jgi:protein phosphatase 1A
MSFTRIKCQTDGYANIQRVAGFLCLKRRVDSSSICRSQGTATFISCRPGVKWGAAETMGPRETMEDAWLVKENLKSGLLYASVFDGHGGASSAIFLKHALFDTLKKKMKQKGNNKNVFIQDSEEVSRVTSLGSLQEIFKLTDGALIDHIATLGDPECWSGSTATICFIDERQIICANVGDSAAVIGRKGKPFIITKEHRPNARTKTGRDEIERIAMAGGWVTQERVCGILAVSRAFGDYEFKGGRSELLDEFRYDGNSQAANFTLHSPPVIALPHVYELSRTIDDEFIIIATDGIWDVMNGSQAVTFVRSKLKSDSTLSMTEIADALVCRALRYRTQDNIACIIIDLRQF